MSVALLAIFGVVFLGERMSIRNWTGIAFIAVGAIWSLTSSDRVRSGPFRNQAPYPSSLSLAMTTSYIPLFSNDCSETQSLGLPDARDLDDLGDHAFGRGPVDRNQRDRGASLLVAPQRERRDIDAGLAEQAREPSNEARFVLVGDVDHRRRELGVDLDALDRKDARLAVVEHRATDRALHVRGGHRKRDEALVVGRRGARRLLDHDAAARGDGRRRDDVDVLERGTQQTRDRGRSERLDLEAGYGALVGDRHLRDRRLGQLAGERAEPLRERDERLQPRRFFGGDRGEIDRVGDRAAGQ